VHIRFPTLQDVNACFSLDGLVESHYVWQVQRSLEPNKLSVTLQRVRLPRELRLPYPPLGDSLIKRYEERNGIWVAVERSQVIGFVEVAWEPDESLAWLRHLVVDRPYRQRGVGTRLLERAMQSAMEAGLNRMMCVVNVKNDPAIQFLTNRGFTTSGYNDAYFGTGDIALYLSCSLRRRVR